MPRIGSLYMASNKWVVSAAFFTLAIVSTGCGPIPSVRLKPGQRPVNGQGVAFARVRLYNNDQPQPIDPFGTSLSVFFAGPDGKEYSIAPVNDGMLYVSGPPGRYGPLVLAISIQPPALGLTLERPMNVTYTLPGIYLTIPKSQDTVYDGDVWFRYETNSQWHFGTLPFVFKRVNVTAEASTLDQYRHDFPMLASDPLVNVLTPQPAGGAPAGEDAH